MGSRLLLFIGIFVAASNAQAALLSNAVLSFDPGSISPGVTSPPSSGSYFALHLTPTTTIYTSISPFNGLRLGSVQPASGSHAGIPNGLENPDIDQPWTFKSITGMHETSAPVAILSDDNSGNVTLDFTGWGFEWNGIPFISLGGNPLFSEDTSVANIVCGFTCEVGDSFVLNYAAHVYDVPGNPTSGFSNVLYTLYLEGTINAVPIPAAAWLFSSGLIGLIGVARRKVA